MNSEVLDELMYRSGMIAQGCWDNLDDYDRDAIMSLAKLIVEECATVCESLQLLGPYKEVQDATLKDAAHAIKQHFGVNRGPI